MSTTTVPATAAKLMTADEFWEYVQRPENEHRNLDLIRGEVIEMSRPTRLHGIVCAEITRIVGNWVARGSRGYVASNDAGVVLREDPASVVGPDVAYYTDADLFEDVHPKWGDVPPVLAVEVLSPNDKSREVMSKVAEYLQNGTQTVWLVNYEERYLTVFDAGHPPRVVNETDHVPSPPGLPGFTCPLADFFRAAGRHAAPPT